MKYLSLIGIRIKDRFLNKILLFIIAASVLVLGFGNYVIYPSFSKLLVKYAEDEAIMATKHSSHMFFPEKVDVHPLFITPETGDLVEDLKKNFNFFKLKIFNTNGEVVFSTNNNEVGEINKKDYFKEVVVKGAVFTKIVQKDSKSLEGKIVTVDVVETYVPIMRSGSFIGAFELYYDISDKTKMLRNALFKSNALTISLVFSLLLITIKILTRLDRTITERDKIHGELKRTNIDLTDTKALIEKERSLLQQAFDHVSFFIQEVITNQNMDLVFENNDLGKCYEKKSCENKKCSCYGQKSMRCWQIAGTFCGSEVQGYFAQKYESCKTCEVYQDAASGPVNMIAEHFNNMLHILGLKHKDLQKALSEIKTLHGILPICASCKKIRDDNGDWDPIEVYVHEHSEAQFSHSICPSCMKKLYPNEYEDIFSSKELS